MSICVKYTYQNKDIVITTDKVLSGDKVNGTNLGALTGNVIMGYPFSGVIDYDVTKGNATDMAYRKVAIVGLKALYWDESDMIAGGVLVPNGQHTLGLIIEQKLYIAIQDDQLLNWSPR